MSTGTAQKLRESAILAVGLLCEHVWAIGEMRKVQGPELWITLLCNTRLMCHCRVGKLKPRELD